VVTADTAAEHGMEAADLHVYKVSPDRVGIVTVLDGRPIPVGDLAGPALAGHDSFQRAQRFVDLGGCRGLQEEVLLSGAWNLMVRITERNAQAAAESAKGEAAAIRLRAEGQAAAVRLSGEAEAASLRAVGAAKAETYRLGIEALGTPGYTAMQLALILGENRVKLVPDITLGGEGSMRLADVLVGRMPRRPGRRRGGHRARVTRTRRYPARTGCGRAGPSASRAPAGGAGGWPAA
jgi:uncharacterized membrane protein YqiK